MKRMFFLLCCFAVTILFSPTPWGHCQSADEVFEQFGQKYDSLKPPEGSSVGADYSLKQTALAAFYTAKMLSLLSRQNQDLISKYEEVSKKYDRIITQNEKIIELLTTLTKK
jgi:hypothetical protein